MSAPGGVQTLDLLHLGSPQVIASYLLEGDEPALVDCGPSNCVDALEAALCSYGLALADVRHVLLTHIHPDHAGAVGELVRRNPRLQVHVHEVGAPHLVDPRRLERSARRLYGDDFDRLFGGIAPVPEENVHVLGTRVLGLEVVPTPGHAWHHVAFFGEDGVCYPGDALGCLLPPGRFVYPASAPPEIDLEAWAVSLDEIEARSPALLRLPHFGEVEDAAGLVHRVRIRLAEWAHRVESGMSDREFAELADAELQAEGPETADRYRQLPAFELSYAGIKRYFDKKQERERS
jgi:glyoxylase-like metal-dependent hydrolase (beta-lactamase superfamily II)